MKVFEYPENREDKYCRECGTKRREYDQKYCEMCGKELK